MQFFNLVQEFRLSDMCQKFKDASEMYQSMPIRGSKVARELRTVVSNVIPIAFIFNNVADILY